VKTVITHMLMDQNVVAVRVMEMAVIAVVVIMLIRVKTVTTHMLMDQNVVAVRATVMTVLVVVNITIKMGLSKELDLCICKR